MSDLPPKSPFEFFSKCFDLARQMSLPQYEAMVLITATKAAKPSGRMVLLKDCVPEHSFRFFTNFDSRKSLELQENPQAQLLFYWPALGRQIRIEGMVRKASDAESDRYFKSRNRGSQIGAMASLQSRPLSSAQELQERVKKLTEEFAQKEIPRPENWGGFELVADYFEFWEDRADRLHERITYRKVGTGWEQGRLWP